MEFDVPEVDRNTLIPPKFEYRAHGETTTAETASSPPGFLRARGSGSTAKDVSHLKLLKL